MQRDDYGDILNNYIAYTTGSGMEVTIGRHAALKAFDDLRGKVVMNFGCGPATQHAAFWVLGVRQVIGVDVNQVELEEARRIDPAGIFLHYNGLDLADALTGYQIDAALASFSICVIDQQSLTVILRDMHLVLHGGQLVLIEPNYERCLGIHYPGQLHYHSKPGAQSGDHMHITLGEGGNAVELYNDIYHSHADYARMLTKAGFSIDRFEEVRPPDSCQEPWAGLAREYPPFLLIVAH